MGHEGKLRVLVVEDEPLIAMVVENAVETLGCDIVGPVAQLDEALAIAKDGDIDCAILDVNIRGGNSYAVADMLLKRGRPFVLTTGYGGWSIPEHLASEKRLEKPYLSSELENELRKLFGRVHSLSESGENAKPGSFTETMRNAGPSFRRTKD